MIGSNIFADLNICGPLEVSGCGAGSGVCDNNNLNLGLANSNLTYTGTVFKYKVTSKPY